MDEAQTQGIRIRVIPMYVPAKSKPDMGHYLFAYQVTITNEGAEAATLLNRHWIIVDALGQSDEVRGPGVIGEQPRLEPGESFEYVSFCPLSTPTGQMHGSYEMERDNGNRFDAEIPTFELLAPNSMN